MVGRGWCGLNGFTGSVDAKRWPSGRDEAVTVYMLHDAVDVVCKRELASRAAYGMVWVLDSGAMRGCVGIASW
jgi:hypothetical protein